MCLRWPSNGEADIYLGIFAPLLIAAALVLRRAPAPAGRRWPPLRLGIAIIGVIYAMIAAGTLIGPWSISLGPLTFSASQTVKPFSIAVLCLVILGVGSPTFVDAFRRRSIFAFYIDRGADDVGFHAGTAADASSANRFSIGARTNSSCSSPASTRASGSPRGS